MPIYEYRCYDCGQLIEVLQPVGSSEAGHPCSQCGGVRLEKCLSVMAPPRQTEGGPPCGTGSGAPAGCGGCCGGCQQ
ncbi:MAG TPA: FmdB family zinc ribbon protein [Patescibacteria group bacterium]|nr:FmdB family zinc ribbon protein [Patescibacteria group bacterium]